MGFHLYPYGWVKTGGPWLTTEQDRLVRRENPKKQGFGLWVLTHSPIISYHYTFGFDPFQGIHGAASVLHRSLRWRNIETEEAWDE